MGSKISAALKLIRDGEFRVLAALWMRWTGLCRYCRIQRRGVVLHYDGSAMGLILWVNPEARREDEDFLEAYLRPGDLVIDAGANIGSLALLAARIVGPGGHVTAFEPHPRIFGFLLGNIKLNGFGWIEARQMALGREAGEARMTDSLYDDQNRISADGSVLVPSARLDAVIDGTEPIALLKVDVEGLEWDVLRGAEGLLGRVEGIYFEVSERHFAHYGYTVAELLGWLAVRGFELRRWSEGTGNGTENWLALRPAGKARLASFGPGPGQ